jgi:8-oxo-dGTP pyrophosphatase MutT (NUDIX family)
MRAKLFSPLARLMHVYWRFARGLTMGVRAVVIDTGGRIFLVKHRYSAGWHLPGGGVEAGETLLDALARELAEEAGIELLAPPVLHAIYHHPLYSRRDHVALFVVRAFRQHGPPPRSLEISDHGFFAPTELPPDVTAGTDARIAEVLTGKPAPARW